MLINFRFLQHSKTEASRLKLLKIQGMKEIIRRRVKINGEKYSTGSKLDDMCSIITGLDANFFALRYVKCIQYFIPSKELSYTLILC